MIYILSAISSYDPWRYTYIHIIHNVHNTSFIFCHVDAWMIYEIQNYDAIVGDTTIVSDRSLYVDFTIPYTDIGLGMVVRNEDKNMWIFLKPLSLDLWMTTTGFCILMGFIVWILEKPTNEEFQGSPTQQIGTVLSFAFSILIFAHSKHLYYLANMLCYQFIILYIWFNMDTHTHIYIFVCVEKFLCSPLAFCKNASVLSWTLDYNKGSNLSFFFFSL